MKSIPEYSRFNSDNHWYAVATAGGDEWATAHIKKAIHNDMLCASDDAATDEQAEAILNTPLEDWIDRLEIYDNDDNLIAHFDVTTWKWVQA